MAGISDIEIDAALACGAAAQKNEPRADAVGYDAGTRRVVITFATGVELVVPVHLLQGLAGATDTEIAEVEILGGGYGLHWESLDVDLTVQGLLMGVFGTAEWMAKLAAKVEGATPPQGERRFEALKDKIGIDGRFDEPLPDDGTMGPG